MKTELIIIGNEILSGNTQEINGQWLGLKLRTLGLSLSRVTVVADKEEDILLIFQESLKRSDLIFTSGGLGPTEDDITKKVLGKFFNAPLQESQKAQEIVQDNYRRFGREWVPHNNFYHIIPTDILPFKNPQGMAPGLAKFDSQNKKMLFCAPGVPREFAAMVEEVFLPEVQHFFGGISDPIESFKIRTFGIPEEKIFFELAPFFWKKLEGFGLVSSLPQIIGVDIVLSFRPSFISRQNLLKEFFSWPEYQLLKPFIWQIGELSAQEYAFSLLLKKNLTLSLAESCTGGYLSHLLTNIDGVSQVFQGGVVTYSNQSKKIFLDVKEETLNKEGAVSLEVAKEMAEGALNKYQSSLALSLTGIAGPKGGSKDKPVGTVCIGLAHKNKKSTASLYHFKGDRLRLKERFAQRALLDLIILLEALD